MDLEKPRRNILGKGGRVGVLKVFKDGKLESWKDRKLESWKDRKLEKRGRWRVCIWVNIRLE